jgi:hypothetical protein
MGLTYNVLHTIKRKKGNCINHILRRNCLLNYFDGKIQERAEATERRGKDVSSYWITLRRPEGARNWKRTHLITLCGELYLG